MTALKGETPPVTGARALSPTLQLEPTFSYQEVATALNVSYSFVQKEATAGRLRATRLGRHMVVTQGDVDAWWRARHDRQADLRASRITRNDQRKTKLSHHEADAGQIDQDILQELGIPTK